MKLISIILLLLAGFSCYSQSYVSSSKKANKYFEKGKEYFLHKHDKEAEEFLMKTVETDADFIDAWIMLSQIYFDKDEIGIAADYYLTGLTIDPDKNANGFLRLADIEYSLGRYKDAWDHLNIWNKYSFSDELSKKKAAILEKNLKFSLVAVNNPVPFNPTSLGSAVNTEQYEYWPSLSVDEQTIFFTVLEPPNPDMPSQQLSLQEDFYFAKKEGEEWVDRTYLGAPINTNANEGAQTITADGKYIIFTACNRPDGHGRMCDLYYSKVREDGSWSEPINLGDDINTNYSEKHPSLSPDGRKLYFASNRGGGKGNYDIWVSEKTADGWSRPVNMGDSINTPGTEQSPFIHPDQKTLYFASDGWPGLGKGDIYITRRGEDGIWSGAKNLGYPINTYNEEIGLIVNASGTKAFYATNRREGTDTDIYCFDIPEAIRPSQVSYITGRVYDARNMKGIGAKFQLIDLQSGDLVMEAFSNPGEGYYFLSLPAGSTYAFNVSEPGYLFYSDHFDIEKTYSKLNPLKKDIPLEPIKQGNKIILHNIFFDTDSYELKVISRVELDKIYNFLEQNKGLKIEISGHTDNTGTESYNLELSDKRASEVVNYLKSKGIASDRLVARGYGSVIPIGDNKSEEGRAANRRTELKIL